MNWMDRLSASDSRFHRLPDFIRLMRLDRPIGIYLLLWPCLWALWVAADGVPPGVLLFVFVSGVVLTRTGGCIVNDYADRNIDGQVKRTRQRPLATGRITPREALAVGVVIVLLCLGLVLLTNAYTFWLSFGALALACAYPFMKRYTHLPQVVLGAAFAWSIPMAFAAVRDSVPGEAWILYAATLLWTVAYDTFYAMVDREDDLKIGVKSTAILFGRHDLLAIALLEAATLVLLVWLGLRLGAHAVYYAGLAVAVGLWARQLWLARQREPAACFAAFLNNHWVGAAVFAGLALHDYEALNASAGTD